MKKRFKTVYFLGAGFSKDAGGPIQNELIKNIFNPDFIKNGPYVNKEQTEKEIPDFTTFLESTLYVNMKSKEDISLEDVFTPIDRCIADGKSLGKYSYKALILEGAGIKSQS